MNKERSLGLFLGQLCGDALGTRYEFKPSSVTTSEIRSDLDNGHLPILGGGPFDLQAGTVTDDSELAIEIGILLFLVKE